MKMIDRVAQLVQLWLAPLAVRSVVGPRARGDRRHRSNGKGSRRNFTACEYRYFFAVHRSSVEQLSFDLRSDGRHERRQSRRREQLSIDESCAIDREIHAAQP